MERDFMGLNSKDSVVVKEEFVEGGCQESGFTRNSGPSWPSSSKVSALPQFVPLRREQDEKPSKNGQSTHSLHDVKMNFSMVSPYLKAHFMGTNQKFGGGTMKQQFPSGNPLAAASVVGVTELGINSKASSVPPQLTIFYGGTVNVFDDISPEKAQAIMLLAGNTYVRSNMTQSKLQMQAPASKHPAAAEQALTNMPPCSGLPSPLSVSSHPIDQPAANSDDYKVSKSTAMLTTKPEPPRPTPSIQSVAASAIISSAVPQARKASLARFLEKRKERVMSAAPYKVSYKAGECGTPESNDICSSSLSVTKET